MEKGILSKDATKVLSQKLDGVVKLKGIWETFDGLAFKTVIGLLDDNFGEKVPEPYKTDIRNLLDEVLVNEDYETAIDDVFKKLDEIVNLKFLSEDAERELFNALASLLKSILLSK